MMSETALLCRGHMASLALSFATVPVGARSDSHFGCSGVRTYTIQRNLGQNEEWFYHQSGVI